ncbi:protein of unknown function [Methanoculleus bourgensis]|uniref:Uncharacterized protein n=1 Tax=Methanoculleus bourgensis TaxID=83986 RepID=A0A0X3BHZ2_9EURY|nr:protein of unknown function [Methanoculleus bourgensis]
MLFNLFDLMWLFKESVCALPTLRDRGNREIDAGRTFSVKEGTERPRRVRGQAPGAFVSQCKIT